MHKNTHFYLRKCALMSIQSHQFPPLLISLSKKGIGESSSACKRRICAFVQCHIFQKGSCIQRFPQGGVLPSLDALIQLGKLLVSLRTAQLQRRHDTGLLWLLITKSFTWAINYPQTVCFTERTILVQWQTGQSSLIQCLHSKSKRKHLIIAQLKNKYPFLTLRVRSISEHLGAAIIYQS